MIIFSHYKTSNIIQDVNESQGQKLFHGIYINPPWFETKNRKKILKNFEGLDIEKLQKNGLVFIWVPKQIIYEVILKK